MRIQTFYLVNLQLDPKNTLNDVKDLMKFNWEEEIIQAKEPDWAELERNIQRG